MARLNVRGVDAQLHGALKKAAREKGVSVNQVVLDALRQAVGQEPVGGQSHQRRHDLDYLAGTWAIAEYDGFMAALTEDRSIDDELWQSYA